MDYLQEIAKEYAKLFDKDYVYTLENGMRIKVYFNPGHFHHLIGFEKLKDLDVVTKEVNGKMKLSANYIFKRVFNGLITYEKIKKSKYFTQIENRIKHFKQINKLIEFEKIIIEFDPSKVSCTKIPADYLLFKKNNDNLYLNLFLETEKRHIDFLKYYDLSYWENIETESSSTSCVETESSEKSVIPNTFIVHSNDYYTYAQNVLKISKLDEIPFKHKRT